MNRVSLPPCLQIRGLTKAYGGVQALGDVSLQIGAGEVHALCGENGAGKSTLIKILAGVIVPDDGEVSLPGQSLEFGSVARSEAAGIAVMHQESTAFPDLDAVDNLFVGREETRWGGLFLDRKAMHDRARSLFERLGESIPLNRPIGELALAQRQMVALARALLRECRLLIMDEPTASLSRRETESLLTLVRQLRREGVSVLYVSHRLDEVFQVADRITVLRDGGLVRTCDVKEITQQELIRAMVGRDMTARPTVMSRSSGGVGLEVRGLTRRGVFRDVTFSVRSGEIVGLAGLVGAGRSEIARAIFGIDRYETGSVQVDGHRLTSGSIREAIAHGVALVPEDRQHEGLLLPMTIAENVSLASVAKLTRCGVIDRRRENELVDQQLQQLAVKYSDRDAAASTLSGGNQQRLVLGRWLATNPRVLLLDEPTRGVDVGAKSQIHEQIRQLADAGLATLVISSELPELLALCDRIIAIRDGAIQGEVRASDATPEQVLELILPDRERVAKS